MSSTTQSYVAFNSPVTTEIAAPTPIARGATLDHMQMQNIVNEAIKNGFNEGAVVVLRTKDVYSRRRQFNWGVVFNIHRYKMHGEAGFFPLSVRWLADAKVDKLWPDELYLIHPSMNDVQFDERLKGQ